MAQDDPPQDNPPQDNPPQDDSPQPEHLGLESDIPVADIHRPANAPQAAGAPAPGATGALGMGEAGAAPGSDPSSAGAALPPLPPGAVPYAYPPPPAPQYGAPGSYAPPYYGSGAPPAASPAPPAYAPPAYAPPAYAAPPPGYPPPYAAAPYAAAPHYASGGAMYGYPQYAVNHRSKPGLVTAVGVLGIIIASAGLIGNFVAWRFMDAQRFFGRVVHKMVVNPVGSVHGIGPNAPTQWAHGLDPDVRQTALAPLLAAHPLSEGRRAEFDFLLEKYGQDVFPYPTVTAARAQAAFKGARLQLGAGSAGGADVFDFVSGSVEVYDDHAVFRPANGDDPEDVGSAAPTDASTQAATSPAAMAAAMAQAQAQLPPFPVIPDQAVHLSETELALSFALSTGLLIIAILMLRGLRRARRLFFVYIGLKIPVVIFGYFAAVAWANATAGSPLSLNGTMSAQVSALIRSIVYLIFPIGALIVLNVRSVRAYYSAVISG